MTTFYVIGAEGRDKASLEFQLWDSGDEVANAVSDAVEEIVVMPLQERVISHEMREIASRRGIPIVEAHRESSRTGTTWRLVYGEDYVAQVDPEFARQLAEQEIEIDQSVSDTTTSDGLYVIGPTSSMRTWTKRRLDVLNVRPEDVDVYDIAHALARQCRFNGHVESFLSVARHSVWVSSRLRNESAELQLWGLLHDASEAYIGDMIKPLKHSPEMAKFVEVEDSVEAAIAGAFGLPFPMPDIVKDADRFVGVEVEIGMGLRETHTSTYEQDETLFLERYFMLDASR